MNEPADPLPPRPASRLGRVARLARVSRIVEVMKEEMNEVRPALLAGLFVSRLLPLQTGNALRAELLRRVGYTIGEGTLVCGAPRISGGGDAHTENLTVGRSCVFEVDCTLDLGAKITIGDRVTIGHQTVILTSSHDLGPREHRAGALTRSPVTIGAGAWIGARCIILPGTTIGEGAIVNPGSLVNKDVPPHTRVGGVPAKAIETLHA